jgi:toxin-antitoxin system PIN domain toxin
MIVFDTNVLLHSHRADSPFHKKALEAVRTSAEGQAPWAVTWSNLHEFLAIATNPRVFQTPTPLSSALKQVESWLKSPTLVILGEAGDDYWKTLSQLLTKSKVVGARVHDARIAAICLLHKADVLCTADRDFSRFPQLKTRNPLL